MDIFKPFNYFIKYNEWQRYLRSYAQLRDISDSRGRSNSEPGGVQTRAKAKDAQNNDLRFTVRCNARQHVHLWMNDGKRRFRLGWLCALAETIAIITTPDTRISGFCPVNFIHQLGRWIACMSLHNIMRRLADF